MKNIWYRRTCFWIALKSKIKLMVLRRQLLGHVDVMEIVDTFRDMNYDQSKGYIPALILVDEFLTEVEARIR